MAALASGAPRPPAVAQVGRHRPLRPAKGCAEKGDDGSRGRAGAAGFGAARASVRAGATASASCFMGAEAAPAAVARAATIAGQPTPVVSPRSREASVRASVTSRLAVGARGGAAASASTAPDARAAARAASSSARAPRARAAPAATSGSSDFRRAASAGRPPRRVPTPAPPSMRWRRPPRRRARATSAGAARRRGRCRGRARGQARACCACAESEPSARARKWTARVGEQREAVRLGEDSSTRRAPRPRWSCAIAAVAPPSDRMQRSAGHRRVVHGPTRRARATPA